MKNEEEQSLYPMFIGFVMFLLLLVGIIYFVAMLDMNAAIFNHSNKSDIFGFVNMNDTSFGLLGLLFCCDILLFGYFGLKLLNHIADAPAKWKCPKENCCGGLEGCANLSKSAW